MANINVFTDTTCRVDCTGISNEPTTYLQSERSESYENSQTTYRCRKCNEYLTAKHFKSHHWSKTGRMSVCIDCYTASVMVNDTDESRAESRARRQEWDRNRQRARRERERVQRLSPADSRELAIVLRVEPLSKHGMIRVLVQTVDSSLWCRIGREIEDDKGVIPGDFCCILRYKKCSGKFTIPRIVRASSIIDRVNGIKEATKLIDLLAEYYKIEMPDNMKASNQKSWRPPIRKSKNA